MPDQAAAVPFPKALAQHPSLRQSLLSEFNLCALSAKLDLDHRIGDGDKSGWSGHPQGRGIIMHRALAKIVQQMADEGERTIPQDVALAILRECLRQHDVPPEEVVTIPFEQIKDMRWTIIKFATDNAFDIEHLADIEQQITGTVSYDNPAGAWVERTITGTLDALFIPEPDWAVVIDYKDTWALPPQSDLSAQGYFQQRFYGYLVLQRFPSIQRVTLREHYIRYSEFREADVWRNDEADIGEELSALVERFDRAVDEGVWPLPDGEQPKLWTPSPGAHCSYCPRPGVCPIFPDVRQVGAITSAEQAERWAAESIVAKAAYDQRTKALKAWGGARGPIPVKHAKDPNRVLGYVASERVDRPTKEAVEAAMESGINPASLYKKKTVPQFRQHTRVVGDSADDADLMNALTESAAQAKKPKPKASKPAPKKKMA